MVKRGPNEQDRLCGRLGSRWGICGNLGAGKTSRKSESAPHFLTQRRRETQRDRKACLSVCDDAIRSAVFSLCFFSLRFSANFASLR